jgi:branched-chain amino acid transport system substrate-binding protein
MARISLVKRAVVIGSAAVLLTACATQSGSDDASSASGAAETSAEEATSDEGAADETAEVCDVNGNSQGITDDSIILGSFTPLTGPVADPGNGGVAGMQAVFDAVNAEGGIDGRTIELITADDKYDPAEAQAAARRLNEQDGVFAFTGGVGTPNFVAVLPYIKSESIPAIGPYAPSNQVGVIDNPNVYMIWPNFVDEFQVSTRYLIDQIKPQKLAMIQMQGDVGDDALKGVQNALEGTDYTLDVIVPVEATTTDYSPMVQELKDSGADWVISINQPTGTGQVIQAAKKIGYEPNWLTQSDMTDGGWVGAFGADANGLLAATKAAPLSSDDPLVQDFVTKYTEATGEEPTLWNAVGYAQALVTVEALRNAPALTRDCLEYSLQNMAGFETGLIPPVTFSADSRQGTSAVGVAQIQDGTVIQVAPFAPVS